MIYKIVCTYAHTYARVFTGAMYASIHYSTVHISMTIGTHTHIHTHMYIYICIYIDIDIYCDFCSIDPSDVRMSCHFRTIIGSRELRGSRGGKQGAGSPDSVAAFGE